jgi:hypothetical protein
MTRLSQTALPHNAVPAIDEIRPEWCTKLLRPVLEWCAEHVFDAPDPSRIAGVFRRKELESAANLVLPESVHTDWSPEVRHAFESFLDVRIEALDHPRIGDRVVHEELLRPEALLICDWQASLFDGAMTPLTDGFINGDGLPPWDTWIGLVQCPDAPVGPCCLLSWVPRWMADGVDSAITIDAARCLSWGRFDNNHHIQVVGWGKSWNA